MVKGFIYKLITDDRETGKFKVYIGSTSYDLSLRLSQHLSNYRLYLDGRTNYTSSFEVVSSSWYEIAVVETVEFKNVDELLQRERAFIEVYRADDDYVVVNSNLPIRTDEERLNAVKRYHQTDKGRAALSRAMKKYYQRKKVKNAQQPPT